MFKESVRRAIRHDKGWYLVFRWSTSTRGRTGGWFDFPLRIATPYRIS